MEDPKDDQEILDKAFQLIPYSVFGDLSSITNINYIPENVMALEDSEIIRISNQKMSSILEEYNTSIYFKNKIDFISKHIPGINKFSMTYKENISQLFSESVF